MTRSLADLQAEYYDNVPNPEFELRRPHEQPRLYQYLMQFKFEHVCSLLDDSLANKTVVCVCCGSGMDAEFLARTGAHVIATDISTGAVARARQRMQIYGPKYEVVQADVHHLPFPDLAFDYAFVHDGLHHLMDPQSGVAEMARVARRAVIVCEPTDAAITELSRHIGLAKEIEESGNRVRRIGMAELKSWCRSSGLGTVRWRRYLMRYGHPPSSWWKLFDNQVAFISAIALFRLVCVRSLGRWGNKLALVAERTADRDSSS